jgi:hypothetical protein
MGIQAKDANKRFWKAPSVRQGAEILKKSSPYRFIAESGIEATSKHDGLLGNVSINEWITMSIQRAIENVQSRTQDGLAFLATVGSTAPFVGLFGTVWGIYHALTAIGIAGQASIDKVAGPVGEALIATPSIAVAVPAVLGYNWLIAATDRHGPGPQLRRRPTPCCCRAPKRTGRSPRWPVTWAGFGQKDSGLDHQPTPLVDGAGRCDHLPDHDSVVTTSVPVTLRGATRSARRSRRAR